MKKLLFTAGICLCLHAVYAQKDAEKFARHINGTALKKHLTIIAGDEMQGRETGTEGQRKAAEYIQNHFKNIGLKAPVALNGYQQFYPLYKSSMKKAEVSIGGQPLQYSTDYYVQAMYNNDKNIQASQLVFAGYGISESNYNDYDGLDVTGKVVVLFAGEPKVNGNYTLSGNVSEYSKYTYPGIPAKTAIARQKGAVAAIIINQAAETFSSSTVEYNSNTNVYYPSKAEDEGIDYLVLNTKAAKNIFTQWQADSLIAMAKNYASFSAKGIPALHTAFSFTYQKEKEKVIASNVLGVLEGTDKKDEYLFITAHYDHLGVRNGKIYYGADDDGSGTVAVMQMAEAFVKAKAAGKGPRRTIVFMTVSGEEKGLWGSRYYSDNPVFPLNNTTADLNIDMVGRIDTERKTADSLNYVYVIGHDKLSSQLQVINEGANNKHTGLVLDYKYDDPKDQNRIYYRSDHYNFARKGVPILFFYDGMLKADYHKPTDTVDKIYWDLFEKRTHMIFYTAWEIANRNEMLVRDIPLATEEED
jgi:Zn-dependent M28 family amino/carboxypeptidase